MARIRVPYEYDGREFEGMLVYDDTVTEKRPALFMQPDWLGVCDHSADMAAQAGGSDFVMMVADMFGKGYGEVKRSQEELGTVARATRNNLPFVQGCGAAAFAALTAAADEHGLIVADRFDATILRQSEEATMNAARRKAQTLRFAMLAARRLREVTDPVI